MEPLESVFGPNSALVEELFEQFKQNPESVPAYWRSYFSELNGSAPTTNGSATATSGTSPATPAAPQNSPKQQPKTETKKSATDGTSEGTKTALNKTLIKGVAAKIAENMDASLTVPTATSLRVIPVKMLAEDRDIINRQLVRRMEPKASFTHFIAWAAIRALQTFPSLNHGYELQDGKPYRIDPGQVNLGIAIDLPGKDGSRNLVVPNI
ncbi:MAG: 2-oxo acid dehydrogenase subunit E2, partial [Bacteroidetes bacterium]|nr:2-oxo acid dehydrogenase subunit E2 [Bacteroidota bacterium]